ncbi:MAG: hypothetical protein QM679_05910 [Patulibacter sp.]
MAIVDTESLISVQEASKRGVSRLVRDAEEGLERVVLRNSKPVAAIVSMDHLARIDRQEALIADLSLTLAREMTTAPRTHSLDEVLEMFGYSRDDLAAQGGEA